MKALAVLKKQIANAWILPVDEPETIKEVEKKLDVLDIVSDIIPYLIQPQTVVDYQTGESTVKYMIAANGAGKSISASDLDKLKEFTKEMLTEQGQYNGMETAEVIDEANNGKKNEKTSDERLTKQNTSDNMDA